VQLHPGAAVTTFKNVVDRVVTEYGVAELRGSTIRERTRKLIGIAHTALLAHERRRTPGP
jgi:acyl-CoA hydrolase